MPKTFSAEEKRDLVIGVIGPSIAYVTLTRGLYALIDAGRADGVAQHKWYATSYQECIYAATRINGKTVHLHRFIASDIEGMCDHENCNGLDDRRTNLRPANKAQNRYNALARNPGASGFKGVYPTGYGMFQAVIRANKRYIYLGCFPTATEAHQAYIEASKQHAGEFANGGVL